MTPKLSTDATIPAAQQMLPHPIDHHPRRQRIGWIEHPPGQLQPAAAVLDAGLGEPEIASRNRRGAVSPGECQLPRSSTWSSTPLPSSIAIAVSRRLEIAQSVLRSRDNRSTNAQFARRWLPIS